MTSPSTKRTYTLLLSIVFIAIGAYRLYNHFYEDQIMPMYQIALAGFLIALGAYQLITLYRNGNNS